MFGRAAQAGRGGRKSRVAPWATIALLLVLAGGYVAVRLVPHGPRRVQAIVYGDSLTDQAAGAIRLAAKGRFSVLVRAQGGAALCDWLPTIEKDLRSRHPRVIGLNFDGNYGSPCMRDAPGTASEKYVRAAEQVLAEARERHVAVLFLRAPVTLQGNSGPSWVVPFGPDVVDVGASVAPGEIFTWTLPCASWEGPAQGCRHGRIQVRSPDGTHLAVPGQTYQPGAFRYGQAIAAALAAVFGVFGTGTPALGGKAPAIVVETTVSE